MYPKPTIEYWHKNLTAEQFHITRENGTEKAFTGKYNDHKAKGVYNCVCCGVELFDADTKFDSGTGWPSFSDVINVQNITLSVERENEILGVEVSCRECNAHLGHLFNDGPAPTKHRYCINSIALDFKEQICD